jgi:hypothetical protein
MFEEISIGNNKYFILDKQSDIDTALDYATATGFNFIFKPIRMNNSFNLMLYLQSKGYSLSVSDKLKDFYIVTKF